MKFMVKAKNTIMVRVPHCEQVNFHHSRLNEAIIERDRLCRIVGLDPYNKQKRVRIFTDITAKKNQIDLPVGISRFNDRAGNIAGLQVIYKKHCNDKKSVSKKFSATKYGSYNTALEAAIQFRADYIEKLKEHINASAEFIKTHGFPCQKSS